MPAQDQYPSNMPENKWLRDVFERQNEPNLAHEIAALRHEIAELRKDLTPVPSLLLIGREALDEFKRLRCEA